MHLPRLISSLVLTALTAIALGACGTRFHRPYRRAQHPDRSRSEGGTVIDARICRTLWGLIISWPLARQAEYQGTKPARRPSSG